MFITTIWIITAVYLVAMAYIGWWSSRKAQQSYAQYTIADKSMPAILIMFTLIASAMGAGNFIGHADKGYQLGISHFAFILGEQGIKIIFALVFAGFAARFAYKTLAEFNQQLIVNDKLVRILTGLLLIAPGVAWTGGQAMGIGSLYQVFTGADPLLVIIISTIVFVAYTATGGIYAVVYTDLIQGFLVLVLGAMFYFMAFSTVNFNLGYLGSRLVAQNPALWSFAGVSFTALLTMFLTAALGNITLQIYWQRVFMARNSREARNTYLIMGVVCVIMVTLTMFAGMIARTHNPDLVSGTAPWLMKELVPMWATLGMFVLIIAATMSTADTMLNSAVVNLVHDVIVPASSKKWKDKELIRLSVWLTVLLGAISVWAAMKFKLIIDLASIGYAMSGATVAPLLIIGLLWRKDSKAGYNFKNSMVTVRGAQVALIVGAVVTYLYQTTYKAVFGGGVIPGAVVTLVLLVLVSAMTQGSKKAEAVAGD